MQTPTARRATRSGGFTLVELMVTVLIVAVLAGIAVPAYQAYIVRTNRAVAKSCMSEYAQFMERYYTTNLTYVGASPVMGCATEGNLNRNYSISMTNVNARTYTVTATPVNAQLTRDTQCATLTLDQSGTRTESGTRDVAFCW